MSSVKSGLLSAPLSYRKHLRPEEKRKFWKRHRKTEIVEAQSQAGIKKTARRALTRLGRDECALMSW